MRKARFFVLMILLLVTAGPASIHSAGQIIEVEKSKDKVIIGGVQYYIHVVQKGQTPYSIAKAYDISVDRLVRENQTAMYGIREGQALKIPLVTEKPEKKFRDRSKYLYHVMERGQTLYSLSKKYDVSQQEIIDANPGLDVHDIPDGTEIRIPRKRFALQQETFVREQDLYYYHRVKKGETLHALSRTYEVSLRNLRKANPQLEGDDLNVGEYIRIPGRLTRSRAQETTAEKDSLIAADTIAAKKPAGTDSLLFEPLESGFAGTPVKTLEGTIRIALLMPLYLEQNNQRSYIDSSEVDESGRKTYKEVKRPEEWIYPESRYFLEFYEGSLLAIDTLRKLGLNIECQVFDTGQDSLQVERLLRSGRLRNMDLIIGPVYTNLVPLVAEYAGRYKIPVVSPLSPREEVLEDHPYLFKPEPGINVTQDFLASLISEQYDKNLVFLHPGSPQEIVEANTFKNKLFRALRFQAPFDEVHFREVVYNNKTAQNDTINVIEHALESDRTNIMILASRDEAFLGEVISMVHTLSRNYEFMVFGYPEFQNFTNIDLEYYYELKLNICSPHWVDYSDPRTSAFLKKYREFFHTEPAESSFAWNGYDVTFYFLSGLAEYGDQFKYRPGQHNPPLIHTRYNFERSGFLDGFENNHMYRLMYAPDMKIYRIKR